MKNTFKRSGAALISLVLLLVLAVSAGAASSQNVGVKFWKERSDKESMANSGIDSNRTATLTRQANGTYTLTLPVMQVSKLGVTGYLSGLTIGDVTYDGGAHHQEPARLGAHRERREQIRPCDLQHPDGSAGSG